MSDEPPQDQASNRRPGNGGVVPPVAHRYRPGRSGNPGGRPKGQSLRALLRSALDRETEPGRTVADSLVAALIDLAARGDRKAIRDVFDQVEGRPRESVELSGQVGVETRKAYIGFDPETCWTTRRKPYVVIKDNGDASEAE